MITLLTDFGTSDYFVPAVRGVILSLHPQALITDITHHIPAHDILTAAFTLGACWQNFPAGTIHLAVVDPGVGSARRIIVAIADDHFFVGPDNGLFSFVYAQATQAQVFHVTRTDLFRHPISPTFHGRDVFAPIAAHLSLGMKPEEMGPRLEDYRRSELSAPVTDSQTGVMIASIIHVDHFGNCVTNLTAKELPPDSLNNDCRFIIGEHEIRHFGTHYAQAAAQELFAYPGSAGYWEIAVWQASAAAKLKAKRGTQIILKRRHT